MITAADGRPMPTYAALPGNQVGPPVVVVGDMYGRSEFYEELSRRLAALGYATFCPDIFFREGALTDQSPEDARRRWAGLDETQAVMDLSAVLDAARSRDDVRPGRVGSLGCCLGGTLVLNLAATRTDVATVCFYGFPSGSRTSRRPAQAPHHQVDLVTGPVLGLWGSEDASVGIGNVELYGAALRDHGVDVDTIVYPGVGHGFMAAASREPGDLHKTAIADEAWGRVVAFLGRALGSGAQMAPGADERERGEDGAGADRSEGDRRMEDEQR